MSTPTPLLDQWLKSLPPRTQEVIVMAGETVEKFDGNVKMAETLASLAFMRAVEAESGLSELEARDQVNLLKVAGQLLKLSTDLKKSRLEITDKYEGISDAPKPANLGYMVVEAGIPEQIRRLIALNMLDEAKMLCQQNNLDLADFLVAIEVQETPYDDE